jgi:acyl-CoA thioesterase-1
MLPTALRSVATALALSFLVANAQPAQAHTKIIVALGASNTYGKGVSRQEAFPAVLEAMLRSRGYDVQIINAGINGDTAEGMLARLDSSVPPGTKVVILNPSSNDTRGCGRRRGGECASREEHDEFVGNIRRQLHARGIKVVMAKMGRVPREYRQADGRHLTPEAHQMVAADLVPSVVSALGEGKRKRK